MKFLQPTPGNLRGHGRRSNRSHLRLEMLESRQLLDGALYDVGDLIGRRGDIKGVLTTVGSTDFVKFKMVAPGWVDARLDIAASNGPEALSLFDSDGQLIASDLTIDPTARLSTAVQRQNQPPRKLGAGEYLLVLGRTEPIDAQHAGYTLIVNADYAGDAIADARDVGPPVGTETFTDSVGGIASVRGDQDYYRFATSAPMSVQVSLSGESPYYQCLVSVDKNADGRIDENIGWVLSGQSVSLSVPAGTVYLLVSYGNNGILAPDKYTLALAFGSLSPQISVAPTTLDFGNVWIHESKTASFSISNVGDAGSVLNVDLSSIMSDSAFSAEMGGGSLTGPIDSKFSLSPGDPPHVVTIKFAPGPNDSGAHDALFNIRSNDSDPADQNIQVNAKGVAHGATPTNLRLARQPVGYPGLTPPVPSLGIYPYGVAFFYSFTSSSGDLYDLQEVVIRENVTSVRQLPRPFLGRGPFGVNAKLIVPLGAAPSGEFADMQGTNFRRLSSPLRKASYKIHQTYEWSAPWTNGQWLTLTNIDITKGLEPAGGRSRSSNWNYYVIKHGIKTSMHWYGNKLYQFYNTYL